MGSMLISPQELEILLEQHLSGIPAVRDAAADKLRIQVQLYSLIQGNMLEAQVLQEMVTTQTLLYKVIGRISNSETKSMLYLRCSHRLYLIIRDARHGEICELTETSVKKIVAFLRNPPQAILLRNRNNP